MPQIKLTTKLIRAVRSHMDEIDATSLHFRMQRKPEPAWLNEQYERCENLLTYLTHRWQRKSQRHNGTIRHGTWSAVYTHGCRCGNGCQAYYQKRLKLEREAKRKWKAKRKAVLA